MSLLSVEPEKSVMLKKIRKRIAIVFFALITLLFIDVTGTLHGLLGWMAKIQFVPAILGLHLGLIVFLVVLTLVFGRVYCSVICPLGILQDVISWIAGKRKKLRFRYSPAINWLRYLFLVVFVVAVAAGIGSVIALLDPYGAFGRITSYLLDPFYRWGNNLLAYFAERVDSYSFYSVDVWLKSLPVFIVALLTFGLISVLAWKNGRTYCNTVCPVGTLLGFLSRYAYLRPVFTVEKCNACNLCVGNCKSSCIDIKNHIIDYSRCVVCMNCIDACNRDAISYQPTFRLRKIETGVPVATFSKSQGDNKSRRSFLTMASLLTLSTMIKAQEEIVEGGLAVIADKKAPERKIPVVPPGSISGRHIREHCTGCGLCVSTCPNNILRPSSGLMTFMQPEMSYERGYCRPECTLCSEVCPTGAILKISSEEKSATKIGTAVWIRERCVVETDDVNCGNCAQHCPAGAIEMISIDDADDKSKKIPAVNTERCIGCGACEYVCPSRPLSAIYVEGIVSHRMV